MAGEDAGSGQSHVAADDCPPVETQNELLNEFIMATLIESAPPRTRKRFYSSLWVQVSAAIATAILFGYVSPGRAIAMKPLGDSSA